MRRFLAAVSLLSLVFAVGAVAEDSKTGRKHKIVAPAGHQLDLPFSPAVWSGDLLFLSGAIGNPPGKVQVSGDMAAQTRQTLSNLKAVLKEAGLGLDRVVSMDMYISDLRRLEPFWKVLVEEMGGNVPAGVTVEADLAIPGALLEVSMVAAKPGVKVLSIEPEGWLKPRNSGKWAVMAGDVLFISGMASMDPASGKFVPGDLKAQIDRAMANVGKVLETVKLDWSSVARCRVFLPDPSDYGSMNQSYGAALTRRPPSRATVRARMPHPEARFGVQCMAVRSDDRKVVRAADAAPNARPFSPAIQAGERLYLSGMIGRGKDGFPQGAAAQTRITLEHLQATLEAAGLGFDDVVESTVYLSDVRFYAAMNEVYREMVGKAPPARATVGMPLMSPEALVEIQMTADTR